MTAPGVRHSSLIPLPGSNDHRTHRAGFPMGPTCGVPRSRTFTLPHRHTPTPSHPHTVTAAPSAVQSAIDAAPSDDSTSQSCTDFPPAAPGRAKMRLKTSL